MVFNRNRITRTFNNTPKSNNVSIGPNRVSNISSNKIVRPDKVNQSVTQNRINSLANSSLSIGGGGGGDSIPYLPESTTDKKETPINSQPTGLGSLFGGIASGFNTWKDDTFMSFADKHALNEAAAVKEEQTLNSGTYRESSSPVGLKEKASGTDFMSGTDLQGRQDAHAANSITQTSQPRPYKKGMEALGISSNDSMVWNLPGTKQDSATSNLQFQNNSRTHSGMIDEWQKDVLTNPSRDQTAANTWLNTQLGTIDAMEGKDKNKQMFKKDLTARYDNLFNTKNAPFQSNNPAPVGQQGLTRDEKKALKIQAKKDEEQRALFTLSGQSGPPPQPTQPTQGPTNLIGDYNDLGKVNQGGTIGFMMGLGKKNKAMDGYSF